MGLYIHIPFCRSKCFYCGFYSVASLQLKESYLKALLLEMDMRKEYCQEKMSDTLYFGGGTPSYLATRELEMIMNQIDKIWDVNEILEVSIEVNPEDATVEKLTELQGLGFNRITIGVQSFDDRILKRIHRNHTANQGIQAVEKAKACGFTNIGIDLIIGLPGSDIRSLERDFEIVRDLDISHVSVYILSLDSNSVFEKLSVKGRFESLDEEKVIKHYLWVSDYLKSIGYEHYEISNFAKEFKYSHHNVSYWQQKPYIGLGAAAHSYDLLSRQWNVAHLKKYIDSLNKGYLDFEKEILTEENKFNEYLMTNLRTMWGIDEEYLRVNYPIWWEKVEKKINIYESQGIFRRVGKRRRLVEQAWLVSDRIFGELFV